MLKTILNERIEDRVKQYWVLSRFDKPIGILILLWPALWALWVASSGKPDYYVLLVICLGVVLMRAAGCVMIMPIESLIRM